MLVKRLTLVAGVETAFEFDEYAANSVVVKNETSGEILFCDGPFDATRAAHIPAFSWQAFDVKVHYDSKPAFYVKAVVAGNVEIDFGSPGVGGTSGASVTQLSGSNLELYGAGIATRPLATAVTVGTVYVDVTNQVFYMSDGTNWVVM